MSPETHNVRFVRDSGDWLRKLSPMEWIRAAQGELRRAEADYARKNARAGLASARRAAGMALNGALIVEPNEAWGRSYVDHLTAIARDGGVPERVRAACQALASAQMPGQGSLVTLRTSSSEDKTLEGTRDVIAHAYAVIVRHGEDGAPSHDEGDGEGEGDEG